MDLGGMSSAAINLLYTGGFWVLAIILVISVVFGSLWMRKQGKFHYKAIIFSDNGNGKVGLKFTRVGWFKSRQILNGLFEIGGERRLETKDKRIVQQGSNSDMHEINFKPCFLLQEKADDPKILVPISKFRLDQLSLEKIMSIAPADFRDASSKIISDSEKEGMAKWEQYMPLIAMGLASVILFVSIILVIQYAKGQNEQSLELYNKAAEFYKATVSGTAVSSTNAP